MLVENNDHERHSSRRDETDLVDGRLDFATKHKDYECPKYKWKILPSACDTLHFPLFTLHYNKRFDAGFRQKSGKTKVVD
jgi:hypothetical protein